MYTFICFITFSYILSLEKQIFIVGTQKLFSNSRNLNVFLKMQLCKRYFSDYGTFFEEETKIYRPSSY